MRVGRASWCDVDPMYVRPRERRGGSGGRGPRVSFACVNNVPQPPDCPTSKPSRPSLRGLVHCSLRAWGWSRIGALAELLVLWLGLG